jgi:RHS repeat-associated protein
VTNRHANGAIKNLTYGNALTLSTTQNERQLPQTRVVGTILNYTMGYDRNGNLTSVVDGAGGIESRTMDYDNVNRLILATAPNIYGIETFAYDPLDNLRHSQIGTVTFDYLLDSNGKNRLDQINIDGQPFLDYASNEQGDTTRRNRIPSDWIFANGFEESPSLRQVMLADIATTQELIYDRAHRLTGIGNTPGLADIEQYTYDAHGHRVATVRASDGLKRYQVYSKAGELLFTQDHRSNEIAEYVNLDGSLVARRMQPIAGGTLTVTYSHTDMRGTPVVETNAAGTPSPDRTILAPYGAPYSGVYREGPSFTGHATDATTGLSYMQQRYYDPIAARFLSVDPIGVDSMSFGRYWYANNNPMSFVDPDGRNPVAVGVGACAASVSCGLLVAGAVATVTAPASDYVANKISSNWTAGTISNLGWRGAAVYSEQNGESASDAGDGNPSGECVSCGGETTTKIGTIADAFGKSPKEVKDAIHDVKDNLPKSTKKKNPDVEVCTSCGEVYPQTVDGKLGDTLGNINDKLESN